MSRLNIYKRDDVTINLTVKDSDGVAIDITGYKFWLTAKSNPTDSDADAAIQKTVTSHSDPTNGITAIVLTKTDTDIDVGTYAYDIQMRDTNDKITTLVKDDLIIKQDITISE